MQTADVIQMYENSDNDATVIESAPTAPKISKGYRFLHEWNYPTPLVQAMGQYFKEVKQRAAELKEANETLYADAPYQKFRRLMKRAAKHVGDNLRS